MNHPRPEDLSAYVDRTLPVSQVRSIADHVAACGPCREMVQGWESLRAAIRSVPVVEPEPWFAERMEAMVAGEEADVERWAGPERVAGRAVFGLAVIVLGLLLAMSFRQEATAPPVDRMFALGSGDSTTLLASSELTRENLLQATIVGE
ncbi:MAG: zf-HC2 domain-containing protein [Bacteroidetes bacterium]|jgi:anti-sigma factor RsiW|nr:zf-HC2 domain-containing protein [Bacteroidota bacterium]